MTKITPSAEYTYRKLHRRGCFVYYELYMDEFFLENFCLDFLLLFLTGIAAKLPIRFGRMAVGAAFGSLCSCLLLFLFPSFSLKGSLFE